METPKHRVIFVLITAMVLGYASWVLPRILIPGSEQVELPILITVKTNGEVSRNISIICQIISGLILGYWDPKRGLAWGASTMLPIFILSALDAALGFSSHNLLGIEFVMYVIFTIPPMIGALFGIFINRLISRRRVTASKETP
jgi:hypothetical protein